MSYLGDLAAQHRARQQRFDRAARPSVSAAVLLPHSVPVNLLTGAHWRVLLKLVALKRGIHQRDILGDSHEKPIVAARFEAMHLVRTHMEKSYPAIGRLFNRDHTSVLYAVRKVERERDSAKSGRILVVNGKRTNISGLSPTSAGGRIARQIPQADSARSDEGTSSTQPLHRDLSNPALQGGSLGANERRSAR